jgi:Gly-Xaa carboxypeptidase
MLVQWSITASQSIGLASYIGFSGFCSLFTFSSVGELQQHMVDLLTLLAAKYDLTFVAFGSNMTYGGAGQIDLSNFLGTEPLPMTPMEYGPWALLQGSIKAAFESSPTHNSSKVIVIPSISIGTFVVLFGLHISKEWYQPGNTGKQP